MKFKYTKKWKEKQIKAIKDLTNLHDIMGENITLLNEPYVRAIGENNDIQDIQNSLTEVYNKLIPLINFYEKD